MSKALRVSCIGQLKILDGDLGKLTAEPFVFRLLVRDPVTIVPRDFKDGRCFRDLDLTLTYQ